MAIDFPSSPITGQSYIFAGVTYTFTAQGVWATAGAATRAAFSASVASADQTGIATETYTKVNYPTANFNDSALYNTSLSRWTPPAGRCQLMGSVVVGNLFIGVPLNVAVYKNGAIYRAGQSSTASATMTAGVTVIDACNGTDYYEIWVFCYTSSTATALGVTAGGGPFGFFMGATL